MAASTPYLGQIQAFGFNFAPKNWAQCNGQLLAIAQSQALFALLGTTFGGNGTTTFQLPNLQSRAPRGAGQGPGLSACVMGQISGTENVTLTIANLPAHNHVLSSTGATSPKVSSQPGAAPEPSPTNNVLGALNDPSVTATNAFYNSQAPDIPLKSASGTPSLSNTGGSTPTPVMQPYLVVNFCIALAGVFPSRN